MSTREEPIPGGSPFQFRLRSLFALMTAAAAVSALGHYLGVIVLRWLTIGICLTITLAFVMFGPCLVTEVLTLIIDKSLVIIRVTRRALRERLTVAAHVSREHDVTADIAPQ